jgi:hypothetical protein
VALAEIDAPPRVPFRVAAVLAIIPAIGMARSGFFGRGGVLALSGSAVFATAAVLLWTAGSPRGRAERIVAHVLRRATLIAFVGYVGIASGPGPIVLLAVPFYWLSVPIVVTSTLIWIAIRGWTALAAGSGS